MYVCKLWQWILEESLLCLDSIQISKCRKKVSKMKNNLWLLPGGNTDTSGCGGAVATGGCIPTPGEYGGSGGYGAGYFWSPILLFFRLTLVPSAWMQQIFSGLPAAGFQTDRTREENYLKNRGKGKNVSRKRSCIMKDTKILDI